jgi:TolB protein
MAKKRTSVLLLGLGLGAGAAGLVTFSAAGDGLRLLGLAAEAPRSGNVAWAQPQADELPRIRITDPNRDLFRLGLPNVVGDADLAREALEIERRDLDIIGLFRLVDPASFPPDLQREGLGFSSALWSQVGAQGVAKLQARRTGGQIVLDGKLYQIGRGDQPVLEKTYRGAELRPLVHAWANDVIAQFTGQRGIFGSRIVFAMTGKGSREIASVGADGSEMRVVTKMGSESMMPAFSPGGDQIAFTSFLRGTPDLWVVSAGGGRARKLSTRPGMNTGATFSPDGRHIVLTLSFEGNSELYRVAPSDGRILDRLTRNPAADLSATYSPDGSQIAFVSDRQGTPQIFLMSAAGGNAKRLTFQGSYNQTPRWNPRADKPLIAFSGRDERGSFDIFVYDVKAGKIDRMTQGQGSNLDPAWSPDGRLLVYTSNRGGLFVLNVDTRKEFQIWKGGAASPHWGPAPKAP